MILEGLTDTGAVVPVQVTNDGKLVAQGLQGAAGPAGPAGPPGPEGPAGDHWTLESQYLAPTNGEQLLVPGVVFGNQLVDYAATKGEQDGSGGLLAFSTTAPGGSYATVQMQLDSSGNLRFNSGYGSVATAYGCRAWVNFNGTGTVAIRASGNVSSITDNGTGDYTVNFTTAMPDNDYCAVLTGNQSTAGNSNATTMIYGTADATMLTNSIRVNSGTPSAGTLLDRSVFCVAIFR